MFPIYFCKSSNTVINQSKVCSIYTFGYSGPGAVGGVAGISCDFAGSPYAAITANTGTTACVINGSLTPLTPFGGTVTIAFQSDCTS
jgi:hypothetical protein